MRTSNNTFSGSGLVNLKNQDWLDKQRIAGKIVAGALKKLQDYCEDKTFHSMSTLNDIIEKYIIECGATPTFKGYKKSGGPDFPAGVCISINRALVHGIPDDTVLAEGDVVSFDLGATYQGAIADSAITCIFGKAKDPKHVQVVEATQEALMRGIQAIEVGKRLGCIGNAISKYAKSQGFSLVTQYGGHGLDWDKAHASPFVANKAESNEGIRLQENITLAIEPLLVIGPSSRTRTLNDGWTVVCDDICAHFEHTVFLHKDHVEIITDRNNL
jgi:methionyl aminopeptidase